MAEPINITEDMRGDVEFLKNSIANHLHYTLGKDKYTATKRDLFLAVAYTVRDQLTDRWIKTQQAYYKNDSKRVYYLSLEFLMGRTLENALINLNILENCQKALNDLGVSLEQIIEVEVDAGLGNGGLGRLAACLLDSMATLKIPGYGYGIRYDYGIFSQVIQNGYQIEKPENWLRYGNPWEISRPEYLFKVEFYGRVIQYKDEKGILRCEWRETEEVMAMAFDTPIPGYENNIVNTLRLWQAKSSRGFNLDYFNHGDYVRAVEDIALNENISKVLYPNDNIFVGRELRLKQEYFLVSATLQDIIRRYNKAHIHLDELPQKVAIQLNDTHPALAIPELMRILIDREELSWDKAWELTQETLNYTNHTLLPESLERWPVPTMERVLPRHLQIIYEINRRWLEEVEKRFPKDLNKLRALSIIEEGYPKKINMANLCLVGCRKVNGVSALHSELLKQSVFKDFFEIIPEKFTNKTNGVTPRRWIREANPLLSHAITEKIGNEWVADLDQLHKLEAFASDTAFLEELNQIKYANKERLAKIIYAEHEVAVNPNSLFDIQVKRIHEYKRQLLNLLHVINFYNQIRDNPGREFVPRTVIFGGKAAPGYFMAKRIIKLINAVAEVINKDPLAHDFLKVFFLSNYRVSLAERMIPAADLSEQISTAGTEASGTGNMKFSLNGALTICTLDGANVEMIEEVGRENFFVFGLTTEEVARLKAIGYHPWDIYNSHLALKRVLDMIRDGFFCNGDRELFRPIVDSLLKGGDPFLLLADYEAYIQCQAQVDAEFQNREGWNRKALLNIARMGKFSSDRTVKEYAKEIWRLD